MGHSPFWAGRVTLGSQNHNGGTEGPDRALSSETSVTSKGQFGAWSE